MLVYTGPYTNIQQQKVTVHLEFYLEINTCTWKLFRIIHLAVMIIKNLNCVYEFYLKGARAQKSGLKILILKYDLGISLRKEM